MDKKLTAAEVFVIFLKSHRKYASWQRQNIMTLHDLVETTAADEQTFPIRYWLDNSLDWRCTKEGFTYWSSLHKKWKKLCIEFNLHL